VIATAPFRVSFGGGTDVPPYPERHGGCSLSATIDAQATVRLRARRGDAARVRWSPAAIRAGVARSPARTLDLVCDVLRLSGSPRHLDVEVDCTAPLQAGLGSSSAIVVAVLAALDAHAGRSLERRDVAARAYWAERELLGQAGGAQDHYAAAFGGVNFMEFSRSGVAVHPIGLPATALSLLRSWLLLCDSGGRRDSAGILRRQIDALDRGDANAERRMHRLKALTMALRDALADLDMERFGALMHAGWQEKRLITEGITSPRIDELGACAMSAGAIGMRVVGAGGGGFVLLVIPPARRPAVTAALTDAGARVVDFEFARQGVRAWRQG
jgi:D-glycero-alpha-D-manno-heptose-7-phosphate kinase